MATKKATEEAKGIIIPAIKVEQAKIRIVGDSPLIVHAWSEKAKRMMLDKQTKAAKAGREVRDPWQEYCDSLYWLTKKPEKPTQKDIDKATFGFPATAIKAASIDAAYQMGAIDRKTVMRTAFHVIGELIPIIGKPSMREDMVRLGGITSPADLRYRGEFVDWSMEFIVQYSPLAVSLEQVVNAINLGGYGVGIGEWRPAKDGAHGRFHVE